MLYPNVVLTDEQEKIKNEAVNWFHNSSDQVFSVSGGAGTGKTLLIAKILEALNLKIYEYLPLAYTGQAAIVMRTRGFTTAKSIHSALYEVIEDTDRTAINMQFGVPFKQKKFKLKQFIDPNIRLFFIDEGYMVPESMVKDILSFGVKVIVAGDPNQLPPINDNPGFLVGEGIHRLTKLMRQAQDSAIVYLANRAVNGLPIHCGQYGNDVLVIPEEDFIPEMVGFADCICCGTNRTRETINSYVRNLAGFRGVVPWRGERLICRKNDWQIEQDGIALANGLTGTVLNQPSPLRYNKDTFSIDFKPDLVNTIFFGIEVNQKYLTSPTDIKNEMKNMDSNRYDYEMGEFFDYAYALTTHLCQGSEYQNGIYIEEFMKPQMQNQLNYTGITRFKNKLIYIKKKNRFFTIPELPS